MGLINMSDKTDCCKTIFKRVVFQFFTRERSSEVILLLLLLLLRCVGKLDPIQSGAVVFFCFSFLSEETLKLKIFMV